MLFHCFLVKHGTLSNFEPKNHKTFEVWAFLGLLVKKVYSRLSVHVGPHMGGCQFMDLFSPQC